jgi:hypothetical protein
MKKDFSKEIFENYVGLNNRILKIELKDGKILEGVLVSFIEGNRDFDEPYIIRWHFVPENDIERYKKFPPIDFGEEIGFEINQDDIKSVTFK